jgi:hypothetical protein
MPQRRRRRRKASGNENPEPPQVTTPGLPVLDVFKKCMGNGSGKVSEPELHELLINVGLQPSEVSSLLEAAGTSKDSKIDYSQFIHWLFAAQADARTCLTAAGDENDNVSAGVDATFLHEDTTMCPSSHHAVPSETPFFRECRLEGCAEMESLVADAVAVAVGKVHADRIETALREDSAECSNFEVSSQASGEDDDGVSRQDHDPNGEDAASLATLVPPDGTCSWDWPLSRPETKSRIDALERNLQLIDQQSLLQELQELREYKRCHEAGLMNKPVRS